VGRLKKHRKKAMLAARILALSGILMSSLISCDLFEAEQAAANIIVYNEYGEALDIYMDAYFQFIVEYGSSAAIENVTEGEHYLEAKITETETVVEAATVEIITVGDYEWTIGDPPDINVVNNAEQTLKIYMDGEYQFTIVHEENRWIIDVSIGEHYLEAKRESDEAVLYSTTIDVAANTDYTWTISN